MVYLLSGLIQGSNLFFLAEIIMLQLQLYLVNSITVQSAVRFCYKFPQTINYNTLFFRTLMIWNND